MIINKRTKTVHDHNCSFAKKIKPENLLRGNHRVSDCLDNGYAYCRHCSTPIKKYKTEFCEIKNICDGKKIMFYPVNGFIQAKTPHDEWRIIPSDKNHDMVLLHKNFGKTDSFANYHSQRFRSYSLKSIFEYINGHETYREKVPYEMHLSKEFIEKLDTSPVGKKEKKKRKKYDKKRNIINDKKNVLFLLDMINMQRTSTNAV